MYAAQHPVTANRVSERERQNDKLQTALPSFTFRPSQPVETDRHTASRSERANAASCVACNLMARRAGQGHSPPHQKKLSQQCPSPPRVFWNPRFIAVFTTVLYFFLFRISSIKPKPLDSAHTVFVFCVDLRTNSHYFPIRH